MFKSLFAELKRRNVIRVAGVYVVVAWVILQVANNLFPALTLPAWTITFVAVLLLIGFPLTAIIAWAFEITPNGIRRTPAADTAAPATTRGGWIEGVLLLGIFVVVGLSVTDLMRRPAVAPAPVDDSAVAANSLAVLPFTSFSDDTDSNYFADGLTEELIHDVAQISGLKVSGRTSVFYFKNRNEDLREVGRQLGVAHVLEGSVRRSGNRLRITVQLIATADGFHLWSQAYDRLMDDIFAIQEDVAANVAATLEMKLVDGSQTRAPMTHDMQMYQQFLVANALLHDRGLQQLTQARTLFQTFVDREPDNVEALAGYAEATILLASAYLTLDFETAAAAAAAAVEKALQHDPDSVRANAAAGIVYTALLQRTDERRYSALADQALARAVELAPDDPDALAAYGSLLNELGRHEQAFAMMSRAVERDPLSRTAQFQLVAALEGLGRFGDARAKLEDLIARYPDWTNAKQELGEMLLGQGQFVAAQPWLEQAHEAKTNPRASYALANLYLNLGLTDAVRATVQAAAYTPLNASIGQVIILNMQGDDAATFDLARRQLDKTNDRLWRQVIVSTALIVGDLATARTELLQMEPQVLAPDPPIADVATDAALFAGNLLMREGQTAAATHVLEGLLASQAPPARGYDSTSKKIVRAKALAQLGRNEAAIAELRAAQLQGYRTLWDFDNFQRLDRLPWFAGLRNDAAFLAVIDSIEADNRVSKAQLQQLLNSAQGVASGAAVTARAATDARSADGQSAAGREAASSPAAVPQ